MPMSTARRVIAATDAPGVNEQVAAAAQRAGVPVNVVDQPEVGNVVMPSIVDRSPVVIAVAIGTGGNAPVLARMLRAKLELLIPQAYGELANLLGALRERVRQTRPTAWRVGVSGSARSRGQPRN